MNNKSFKDSNILTMALLKQPGSSRATLCDNDTQDTLCEMTRLKSNEWDKLLLWGFALCVTGFADSNQNVTYGIYRVTMYKHTRHECNKLNRSEAV